MSLIVALKHVTRYAYDRDIFISPQEIRLKPAPHTRSPILSYQLTVTPQPDHLRWSVDPLGNHVAGVTLSRQTSSFEIVVELNADVSPINPFDFILDSSAAGIPFSPFSYDKKIKAHLQPYLALSETDPSFQKWLSSEKGKSPVVTDFLVRMNARVRDDIAYVQRPEAGLQTPEETLKKKTGSCRDMAWLLIQAMRHHGIAARFVSGYVLQMENPELHAWAEVYLPGAGWVGLDPTFGLLTAEMHIPLACADDPNLAAPVTGMTEKGVFRLETTITAKKIDSARGRYDLVRERATPYHEFYAEGMEPRQHYQFLAEHIRETKLGDLESKHRQATLALLAEGVTFTVYNDNHEGIERIWPFDVIPRIVPAAEWSLIESGLKQRIKALNLFLSDIYHGQKILKDDVIPKELILNGKDFRPEIRDIDPPQNIYTHISGIDLVRDENGRYLVLEDNLRTPSGVSYMIENRIIERRVLPEFFSRYRVRRVEHYPSLLLSALRHVSPRGKKNAEIVVLTPGIYNAAYFEHTFLAKEMGVELAEGKDLVVRNRIVSIKTTHGLKRVDVIYRRVDDLFLDPEFFQKDSLLGVPGLIDAWRAGNVALVNAVGNGIADDKAVHPYVPDMIRYYLSEEPLLQNVPTYQMTREEDKAYVLDNLDKMVVKAVCESGGYGMLIGPVSNRATQAEFANKILDNPRGYIAQPVIPLSRHLCFLDGSLESRHIDLRPFVIYGEDIEVVPGGLTRVALTKGSLVVNSSQGGGSKDTWVLAE